jgi:hypothetical protein
MPRFCCILVSPRPCISSIDCYNKLKFFCAASICCSMIGLKPRTLARLSTSFVLLTKISDAKQIPSIYDYRSKMCAYVYEYLCLYCISKKNPLLLLSTTAASLVSSFSFMLVEFQRPSYVLLPPFCLTRRNLTWQCLLNYTLTSNCLFYIILFMLKCMANE